jgi:hypothetical protein
VVEDVVAVPRVVQDAFGFVFRLAHVELAFSQGWDRGDELSNWARRLKVPP